MFRVNEVLNYGGLKYRVLALAGDQVVWICIDKTSGMPSAVYLNDLSNSIEQGMLSRSEDPYEELAYIVPELESSSYNKRDKNYELIKPIVVHPQFFEPKIRAALIKGVVAENGTIKKTLYNLLRRYWQRGQTPNALLPDYKKSGAKGKKRKAVGKKLGRPRKYTPGVGVGVDKQVERLFRIAIDRYLLKDNGLSFPYAHRRFMELYKNYFPDTPESEIPTKWQMLHFYKREYGQVEKLKKRTCLIEYNKDKRPLIGTANSNVLGPGSRFEIDATIADIYLVSDSDRGNIVGRPVIYMVIDVFSRMVAGFYVGFESPSYAAAMQALASAMTDKVEWCKLYGLDITYDDWPIVGLPNAILADRGELLGHQIEALESSFGVRIENAPPYRGDAKGIVERSFRTIQSDFKPFAPGVVGKTLIKKRGGKDYRLEASLSVSEFKKIILNSVWYHNNFHVLEKYDRNIDMPVDLDMTPLSLWNWGIQHRTGRLRAASEDALRISLLPRTKATISDLGISVFGVYYTSPEIVESGWMHRSKDIRRPVGLYAAYDPASADCIYLFPFKGKNDYWVCKLTTRSREFQECSFWDVWQVKNEQKQAVAESKLKASAQKRQLESLVAQTIKEAGRNAPDKSHMSNAARLRGIQSNKAQEKDKERGIQFYKPKTESKDIPAKVILLEGNRQEEDYSYPDYIDELFDTEDS
ncbi:Mu transposase C-terminal domain-containing protein [Desulfovibrio gilichinskyi]|uniref:Mu transposase, C-terminal n=1 Tax=Desulfovibrio gilichinskyi TaxID=1519643 RepID=A0A1X7EIT1_9BACT|nr:Mu transposase C-terminal domain-containing protein [Desulfovibrio gilichinskyi]SMF34597.1 Mu transposase, C-terminal [Desulfovibrio gilichinskyi]